jgi:hypothetical protein
VLYPDLDAADRKLGYIFAMRDHLPPGLLGLLVAAFLAAYMSTISTHLNWGTSYVLNDFYRRFITRDAGERHYVVAARVATALLMGISIIVTSSMDTIAGAWSFLIEAGAGAGLVLILRWYWWRVNAWSEIASMLAPAAGSLALRMFTDLRFPESLFVIVGFTTVVWLTVTFLTPPTDTATLVRFFRRVHPGGPGWAPIARLTPETPGDSGTGGLLLDWLAGVVLVYTTLFGTGKLLLGEPWAGTAYLAWAAGAAVLLAVRLRKDRAAAVVR